VIENAGDHLIDRQLLRDELMGFVSDALALRFML
jgi:hypothetical protein